MATQLLIYQTAIPVSRGRHEDCAIEPSANYSFSDKVNSVPLTAVEFAHAAGEYPIVFAGADGEVMPAAVLGMRDTENLFLTRDHAWDARYIPAFIRRYPFVFSKSPDGKQFMLCVDEAFPGFNREGRGQRLFAGNGEPSPYVGNVLKFLQEYQAQFQRTQAFCAKVRDLDLLEPMQAQVALPSGSKLSLIGFMAVNRAKLKGLPGDTLADLARTDELELLYLHLQSMRNFEGLKDRLGIGGDGRAEPEREATAAPRSRRNGRERAEAATEGAAAGRA